MKVLGIVPARSGSKGIRDKNVRLLNDKPLIAYSIENAMESGVFERIHLSTDSEEYANIGRQLNADIPFLRDKELSNDFADSWDVVRWTLEKYKSIEMQFDVVMLLQPTSPLRSVDDIKNSIELLKNKGAKSIVSVCEVDHPPFWMNKLPESLCMNGFINKNNTCPRQLLSTYYRLNGAIYLIYVDYLMEGHFFYDENCYAYIMPKERSIDIDTEMDFKIAEFLYKSELYKNE